MEFLSIIKEMQKNFRLFFSVDFTVVKNLDNLSVPKIKKTQMET